MITVECSARGADRILLRLRNGWTVGIWPQPDALVLLGAWASHDDHPAPGRLSVVGGAFFDADGLVDFLGEIARNPKVKQHVSL